MSEVNTTPNPQTPEVLQSHQVEAKTRALNWMNPERWNMMKTMAETFIQSQAMPASIKNAAQAIMVMQAGYEAGMQPIESLASFAPINGKMTMYGDALIAKVIQAGHTIEWGECTDRTATVTITRKDTGKSMTETYKIEEAHASGLLGKDVWQKYPKRMLKYKVFSEVAHFFVADALRGLDLREIVESEYVPVEVVKEAPSAATAVQAEVVTPAETPKAPKTPEPPKPAKKSKKEEPKEVIDAKPVEEPKNFDQMPISDMSEADKKAYYKMLVAKELDGKEPLTARESMFIQVMGKG